MNRCLSFAWLGCVGIGGITHEGRREKIPEAQSLYRIVYEASSCMTSALAGAPAGSEHTCVCCSDGFGRGGGRRCHDFQTGDLSRARGASQCDGINSGMLRCRVPKGGRFCEGFGCSDHRPVKRKAKSQPPQLEFGASLCAM